MYDVLKCHSLSSPVFQITFATHPPPQAATTNGATCLFIAAQSGHVEIVEYLVSAGADVEKAFRTGATPLFVGAQNGHLKVVQALIKAGFAQKGHLEIVQKVDDFGFSPLFIASGKGHNH